jgi:hypothetical protein
MEHNYRSSRGPPRTVIPEVEEEGEEEQQEEQQHQEEENC